MNKKEVGELRWIEYDPETKQMSILIDINDESFKKELLQHREIQHIIMIKGKKMIVGE